MSMSVAGYCGARGYRLRTVWYRRPRRVDILVAANIGNAAVRANMGSQLSREEQRNNGYDQYRLEGSTPPACDELAQTSMTLRLRPRRCLLVLPQECFFLFLARLAAAGTHASETLCRCATLT